MNNIIRRESIKIQNELIELFSIDTEFFSDEDYDELFYEKNFTFRYFLRCLQKYLLRYEGKEEIEYNGLSAINYNKLLDAVNLALRIGEKSGYFYNRISKVILTVDFSSYYTMNQKEYLSVLDDAVESYYNDFPERREIF